MAKYRKFGIEFFNPQVDDWTPELADVEAHHLANDDVILFPVTGETLGTDSLAEIGFSVLTAMRWASHRFVVVYVEPAVHKALEMQDAVAAKESNRARKLAIAHLRQSLPSNVFVVQSLESMLTVSLKLYAACNLLNQVREGATPETSMSSAFWRDVLGQHEVEPVWSKSSANCGL